MPVEQPPRVTLGDAVEEEPLSPALRAALADRYDIEREIGRGGMATVWLARRQSDGGPVAIKVMRSAVAQALGVRRFIREINIAAEVKAPSLVPLEGAGVVDGLPYYIMPFVAGGSLRQRLSRDRNLAVPEAVRITAALARGLSALHEHGFIHRDIKPENVLLGEDGSVLLADYGIARAVTASAEDLTSTGVVVGTPMYMSPEQASGEGADPRSDQYSLGCLFYEMLAGVPPFHGASAHALIARHQKEPPPPLHIVRDTVPPALEAIIMRTLAKVPADRYGSVADLLAALESVDVTAGEGWRSAGLRFIRRRRVALGVAAAVVVAAGIALYSSRDRAPLDASRVVVFPLAETDSGAPPREGEDLALLIGSALERAEGTRWLDGTDLLTDQERANARGASPARVRSLARGKGARYSLTGHVTHKRDSIVVQTMLRDVATDEPVAQETERGTAGVQAGDLTLRAVVRMLPRLTGLERVVDVSGIIGRQPAAVHDWLMGERDYRGSNMESSLRYLEAAIGADSLLAPAAFRGAVAALWTGRPDTARSLVRLALRHADALSPQQTQFAHAFERFLAGRADDAIAALRPLLQPKRTSADAWMLAGEIQLHLLPTVDIDPRTLNSVPPPTTWPLEERAEKAFIHARELDPGFSPPLAHLSEMAARQGNVDELARLSRDLERTKGDSVFVQRMAITERCLRKGVDAVDWSAEARRSTLTLYRVGAVLQTATDPRARRCGVRAFSAVLSSDTSQGPDDYGSLLALHGMLVAQGQSTDAVHMVDSAVTHGMGAAFGLIVLDVAAGLPASPRATAFANQLFDKLDSRAAPSLWLLTIWNAQAGDTARLWRVAAVADARKRTGGQRVDSLVADVSAAYVALARRDSAGALRRFAALRPTAVLQQLEGAIWEALAPERLEYARLLLARGDAAAAHRVASTFDSPAALINQLFLPASLDVRARAARALTDTTLEGRARTRMAVLAESARQ
jgi:eukaryotic-like serine/threonine-protein kinase